MYALQISEGYVIEISMIHRDHLLAQLLTQQTTLFGSSVFELHDLNCILKIKNNGVYLML